MAELLDRAQQLVAAGPYSPGASELAAVHAAIYPDRDAVCQTCRGELGRAYYAIQRWVNQQESSSSTSISSHVKNGTTARLHSDITYTPHGLGIAYTNANLTDKAARDILKADPDAAQHFAVLPPEAAEGEDEQELTASQQSAEQAVEKAEQQATTTPAEFDYAKLASALADEMECRQSQATTQPAPATEQPALTASTGGAAGESETDSDTTKPVSLSRANKEQLTAFYTAELGQVPMAELTNDQLRDAIAERRAGQQDPE